MNKTELLEILKSETEVSFIVGTSIESVSVDFLRECVMGLDKEEKRQRAIQSIEQARAKGKKIGRPKQDVPTGFRKDYEKLVSGKYGEITVLDFCKIKGIATSSFYRYKKMIEMERTV